MSKERRTRRRKVFPFVILSGAASSLLVVSSAYTFAPFFTSSFVGHTLLAYVHPISDEPADAPLSCRKPIIGRHYFGDFQSEFCRLKHGRLYGNSSMREIQRLLSLEPSKGKKQAIGNGIQASASTLRELRWFSVYSNVEVDVSPSGQVTLEDQESGEVDLISEEIPVTSGDAVRVTASTSLLGVLPNADAQARLTIAWLDSDRDVLARNGVEWKSRDAYKVTTLDFVDAPHRDSKWMKIQISLQGHSRNIFEVKTPRFLERLDSLDNPEVLTAFIIGERIRSQYRDEDSPLSEDEIRLSVFTDALLRGHIAPNDALAALTQAEQPLATRQFPSYFLFLLPLMPFANVQFAFAIALLVTLTLCRFVLRRLSATHIRVLLLIPAICYAIWRGNLAWTLAVALLLLWLTRMRESLTSPFPLLLSAALKPTLLLFSILYLKQRHYHHFIWSLIGFCVLQAVSGFIFFDSIAEVTKLVSVTLESNNTLPATNQRLGMRSDMYSLLVGFARYAVGLGVTWLPSYGWSLALSILRLMLVILICAIAFTLGRTKPDQMKLDGSLALLVAAVILLFSPPTFLYSLVLVGVIPLVYRFKLYINVLIGMIAIPIFIPVPINAAMPPNFALGPIIRWPADPAAWTHWTIAGIVSSCALSYLVVDRSVFLLRSVASFRDLSELYSTETR